MWKGRSALADVRDLLLLQRSHTFEGVEGTACVGEVHGIAICFNGATPLRVWKDVERSTQSCFPKLLQRSHTFEGVEGGRANGQGELARTRFNGATPLRVWKGACK